ncbi:MAG: hypothetical protein GY906_18170 [bacterium]|nr:hypothetical protein [bacterium]
MPVIKPGDWVTIQWRANTARDLAEFPREAAGRMAKCVELCQYNMIKLWFPYPVKMRDGSMQQEITIPTRGMFYHLQPETIIDGDFKPGLTEGTVMVPVALLYEKYWCRFGKSDPAWTYKDSSIPLQQEIEAEGLRAPVILGRDLGLRYGSHRVLAYHRLGREFIESYITDADAGAVKVRVPPEPVYHGCKGRCA